MFAYYLKLIRKKAVERVFISAGNSPAIMMRELILELLTQQEILFPVTVHTFGLPHINM